MHLLLPDNSNLSGKNGTAGMFFFFHINLASCRYFLIAEPQIHAANTMHRIVVILGNVLPAHCFWRPYTVSQVTGGQ